MHLDSGPRLTGSLMPPRERSRREGVCSTAALLRVNNESMSVIYLSDMVRIAERVNIDFITNINK